MATEKLRYVLTANTSGFSTAIKAAGALVVTAFVAAVKITADFEKQLSKLRGVSGATEKQMEKLEKQARNLGKATAFTAREVASAQTELAKLGFTTNEILNSTGGVLDLAAGLGTDLSSAAALTGSTLRQFSLDSSETTRVVDILSKSTTESALDFESLKESLKLIAPIANTMNVSIEETVGMLETLANAGIKGSIAGTGLRKAFIDLNAAGIPLATALDNVKNSSDQLGTAVELVGKRAATAFVVLARDGYKSVTDFDGAANDLRVTMEDNLIGDFDKLKSAVSELGITVGQTTDGPLRSLVQWMTDFINGTETTLGFVNSLTRAWYFFYESLLLVGRAAEKAWISLQILEHQANPFSQSLVSKESLDRLKQYNDALDDINTKIIQISDYGGVILAENANVTVNQKTGQKEGGNKGGDSKGRPKVGSVNELGDTAGVIISSIVPQADTTIKKLQELKDKSIDVGAAVSDVFTALGDNIANSMAQSGDALGAFLGTFAQFLLQAIGKWASYAITKAGIDSTVAGTSAVAGATTAAAATGPAFPITLPVFISAALAGVAAAMSSVGGKAKGSGSTSSSVVGSPQSTYSRGVNSQSDSSNNGGLMAIAKVQGQDLILAIQNANYSRQGYNPA